jgi:hypothetical protein
MQRYLLMSLSRTFALSFATDTLLHGTFVVLHLSHQPVAVHTNCKCPWPTSMQVQLRQPSQVSLVCNMQVTIAGSMTLQKQILAEYGPYCPPSRARALRHYYDECSHHFMFSFWRTKISDLTEFGSHMLYLSLLWHLSIAFAALLVVLGLPLIVAYATKGNFFANGLLRKPTLGNYGPIYVEGALRAGGVVRTTPLNVTSCIVSCKLSFNKCPKRFSPT